MKGNNLLRRGIGLTLAVVLVLSCVPAVSAASEGFIISLYVLDDNADGHEIHFTRMDGIWYVDLLDMAKAANCQVYLEKSNQTLKVYSEGNVMVALLQPHQYQVAEDRVLTPFETLARSLGLYFYVDSGAPRLERNLTERELQNRLDYIFSAEHYYLGCLIEDMGITFQTLEALAWSYSILSSFSFSAWLKAISGKQHEEFFDAAFANILSAQGSSLRIIDGLSDLHNIGKKGAEFEEKILELLEDDGALGQMLREMGIDEDVLRFVLSGSTDESYLKAYKDVADFVQMESVLEVMASVCAAADAEAELLYAAQFAFEDSGHVLLRKSLDNIIQTRLGSAGSLVSGYAENAIFDTVVDSSAKKIEKLLRVKETNLWDIALQEMVTGLADYGLQMGDKVNAPLMLSVYEDIQYDLGNYYAAHRYDGQSNTLNDMRLVGIMYIKAAIAAYENLEFDEGMQATVTKALGILNQELETLMSYSDPGEFVLRGFIDYLDLMFFGEMEQTQGWSESNGAYLSMDLWYTDSDGTSISIPQIGGADNSAVRLINRQMRDWFDSLVYAHQNHEIDGEWYDVRSELFDSGRYLSAVCTYDIYPTYGTDGMLRVWVYDKENACQITLDQALAQVGESVDSISADFSSYIQQAYWEHGGYYRALHSLDCYYDYSGELVLIASVEVGFADAPEWIIHMEWKNGVCSIRIA